MTEDLRPPQEPTDVRGLIDCCPTQIAYVKGHRGKKASMKNVVEVDHTFYISHEGSCEFCGQKWVAHYSHLTRQIQYHKEKSSDGEASVQDDQG